jgi:hypothetical protein
LKDDSSPLDGQREKTRVWHTPVGRQRKIAAAVQLCHVPQSLRMGLAFFLFCGKLSFVKLFHVVRGRPSAAFFVFSVLHSKLI